MDEPWKHYAEWKKVDIKGYTFYDSIHNRMFRTGKFLETESRLAVATPEEKEK